MEWPRTACGADDPADCPPCSEDAECASGLCVNDGDLCPAVGEVNHLLDTNRDGIGDECQCGDQSGDGNLTALDIGGTAQCANGALAIEQCDATKVDTNGDNTTTAIDIGAVAQAVNGVLATSDLRCVQNP